MENLMNDIKITQIKNVPLVGKVCCKCNCMYELHF